MDPVADARALVGERFPDAAGAFLGAGVLSDRRTATSDLDIVVLLADDDPRPPFRESLAWRGWPVELFVHTPQTARHWFGKDQARRRPTLARLFAEGVPLAGDDALASEVLALARQVLDQGPPALSQGELDRRRYGLSDRLDDLAGSTDPGETVVIGWCVLTGTAELALLLGGRWLGSGKWLLRELRAADPELAGELLAARDDPAALTRLADGVLARAGGRLWAGFRESGRR